VVAALYIGVETNSGPAPSPIFVGTLNALTAVGHTADLHDLILRESLDTLVVSKMKVRPDAPSEVLQDLAPDG
jgi:hypothetical protein